MNIESNAASSRLSSPKIRWAIFLAIALVALAVRLPQLGQRPMHTDESINAYVTGGLLSGEKFRYDPRDRHGPALFVLAEPIAKLCGAKKFSELTESQLRLSTVITGAATVLLIGAGVEMFGFIACLIAALLFAFAPLPVYYSRYFIHETLFVAATLGLILSGWRALQKKSLSSAMLAGFCAALMLACKETAVIHFFALSIALIAHCFGTPASGPARTGENSELAGSETGAPALKLGLTALAVFIFTVVLLFTWFGQHWAGLTDLFRAIPHLAARAGGEGHEKPFDYYFHLLDPLFVLTLVAIAGIYVAICDAVSARTAIASPLSSPKGEEGRPVLRSSNAEDGGEETILVLNQIPSPPPTHGFGATSQPAPRLGGEREPDALRKAGLPLVIYALAVGLIYSAIPYKTPWLALNLWLSFTLLCGMGVAAIVELIKNSAGCWGAGIAVAFLLATLGTQTKEFVFDKPADEKNPYAYAHTGEDLLRLPRRLEELSRQNKISNPRIAVVAADAWPLPWYLRKFSNVGFWQPGEETSDADFFITSGDVTEWKNFHPEYFGVRPNVLLILWSPGPAEKSP